MYDEDWKQLHEQLRSIAKRRVALEAEEARYLVEAEETRLYRRLGYTSMIEYMERELYYGPHAANERLRVAHELQSLPLIAELFAEGELCFSAVRELTRVATPETEEAFLRKARGQTAHSIQEMVSGLKRGDAPDSPPDPRLVRKRVMLELGVETFAKLRALRKAMNESADEPISDDAFVTELLHRAMSAADGVLPPVQIAMTTCKQCKKSVIETDGESLAIDDATAARLACDAELIGDLESNELTRVTSAIPAAIQRKVLHRDGYACTLPGCRSKRFLTFHHIEEQALGGDHSVENLTTICFGHHMHYHRGAFTILGRAPDLTFVWNHDVESGASPSWDWVTLKLPRFGGHPFTCERGVHQWESRDRPDGPEEYRHHRRGPTKSTAAFSAKSSSGRWWPWFALDARPRTSLATSSLPLRRFECG